MTGVMGKLLVMGVVLSSIVACSSDSSDSNYVTNNINTYSCTFKVTDGDPADYSALNTSKNVSTYFEKEYNQNYLKAVATADVEATIDFINQTAATVYKSDSIPTNLCTQPLFAGAKVMPLDVEARWAAAKDRLKKGTIAGLYLPKTPSSKENPSLHNGAAIVVRENTNRWTLVHEFMHHLFMLRSVQQGYNDAATETALALLGDSTDKLIPEDGKLNAESALKLAPIYAKYATTADTYFTHRSLEEMTIEAALKEAAKAGTLKYVPTEEIDDNWYLNTSAEKALASYAMFESNIIYIASKLPDGANSEVSALADAYAIIQKRKKSIELIKTRFPMPESSKAGALLKQKDRQHVGCAHENNGEKIFEMNDRISQKIKNLQ